jgi:5-methylcytosine-specific restriction endonuclease McrA
MVTWTMARTRPDPSNEKPPPMWVLLREYPDAVCTYCRVKHKEVRNGVKYTLTRDHIIPLSQCGRDTMENIQFLCRTCNQAKADSM